MFIPLREPGDRRSLKVKATLTPYLGNIGPDYEIVASVAVIKHGWHGFFRRWVRWQDNAVEPGTDPLVVIRVHRILEQQHGRVIETHHYVLWRDRLWTTYDVWHIIGEVPYDLDQIRVKLNQSVQQLRRAALTTQELSNHLQSTFRLWK